MALTHSRVGVADLSRHLIRLNMISRNFTSSIDTMMSRASSVGSTSLIAASTGSFLSNPGQIQQSSLVGGVPTRGIYTKRMNWKEAKRKYKDDKDAEDAIHCKGFTYYPRFPNHKDPPVEPAKLFMVRRIRTLWGCPWWEKLLIRQLKLTERRSVQILKNTPTVNQTLYKVKHLVEIIPITMPYGLPDKPENGFLKDNGQFVSYNPLSLHGEEANLEEGEKQLAKYYEKNVTGQVLKERLRYRWYQRFDVVT